MKCGAKRTGPSLALTARGTRKPRFRLDDNEDGIDEAAWDRAMNINPDITY
jgi:hypothetical protein